MPSSLPGPVIDLTRIDAVIFDMDGVVTDSASVHAAAWKEMFDPFLAERSERSGVPFEPFSDEDYRSYVDGKPRYEGVRCFLHARGIDIPEGSSSDSPDRETVRGLGNRKDRLFLDLLRERGVRRFDTTVQLVDELVARGARVAVVSASRNMEEVLATSGVADLFLTRVAVGTPRSSSCAHGSDPQVGAVEDPAGCMLLMSWRIRSSMAWRERALATSSPW